MIFLDFTRDNLLALLGLWQFKDMFIFELIDMAIMTFAIGYIFSSTLQKPIPSEGYDPLEYYKPKKSYLWENMKFAMLAAAPAVVLHELSHKFVAMAYGVPATLYAPYGFYLLAIILKAVGFPILFFVGGFVVHPPLPVIPSSLVAFAGPAMNFLLWGLAVLAMKKKWVKRKHYDLLIPFARINLFLGVFNMIPLPGFDGWFIVDLIKAAF